MTIIWDGAGNPASDHGKHVNAWLTQNGIEPTEVLASGTIVVDNEQISYTAVCRDEHGRPIAEDAFGSRRVKTEWRSAPLQVPWGE